MEAQDRVETDEDTMSDKVSKLLWTTLAPIVFVAGCFGNVVIIFVLRKHSITTSATNVYVMLIAIADLGVLLLSMVNEWLDYMDIVDLETLHPVSCKMIKVFGYVAMDVSIWLVVLFTGERFLAVCLPFKHRDAVFCQPRYVQSYFLVCTLAGFLLNGPTFFTRGAEYTTDNNTEILVSNCGYPSPTAREYELIVRPWLVLTFASAMPILILIFCNSFILYTLYRRRSIQRMQMNIINNSKTEETLLRQVTLMCVSVSFAFVIFLAPSVILLIGKVRWEHQEAYKSMKAVNNLLVFCNHSINFYLYVLTSERFRRQVTRLLLRKCCCRPAWPDPDNGSTVNMRNVSTTDCSPGPVGGSGSRNGTMETRAVGQLRSSMNEYI